MRKMSVSNALPNLAGKLAAAAAIVFCLCVSGVASADTLSYTDFNLQFGDNVSFQATGGNLSGTLSFNDPAGAIQLTGVTTSPPNLFPSTLQVWCIDLAHGLLAPGTFTISPHGAWL